MTNFVNVKYCLFFLGHTHSTSSPASGLGMLTSDPHTPVMAQATVSPDLLEPLQVLPELVFKLIG